MSKPNEIQAIIIAGQLSNLGIPSAPDAPLRIWIQLGFLQRPTEALIARVDTHLQEISRAVST